LLVSPFLRELTSFRDMKSRFAFSPKRKAQPSKYRTKAKGFSSTDACLEDHSRLPAKRRKTVAAKLFKQALRVPNNEVNHRVIEGLARSVPNLRPHPKKSNSKPSGLFALEQLPLRKTRAHRLSKKKVSQKAFKITPCKRSRGARPAKKRLVWIEDSMGLPESQLEATCQMEAEGLQTEDFEINFNQVKTPGGEEVTFDLDDISYSDLVNSEESITPPMFSEGRFVEEWASSQQSQENCKPQVVIHSKMADSLGSLSTPTVKDRIPRGYGILRRQAATKPSETACRSLRRTSMVALIDEDDILSLDDISISDSGTLPQDKTKSTAIVPTRENPLSNEPQLKSTRKKLTRKRRNTSRAPQTLHDRRKPSVSPSGLFSRGPILKLTSKGRSWTTSDPSVNKPRRRVAESRVFAESPSEPIQHHSLFANSTAGLSSRGYARLSIARGRKAVTSHSCSGTGSKESSLSAPKSVKASDPRQAVPSGLFSRVVTTSLNSKGRNTRRAKGTVEEITTKGSATNPSASSLSLTSTRRNRAKANIYLPRHQKEQKLKGTEWGAGVLYEAMTCFETRGVILLMEKELQHFTVTYSPGHTLIFPPMNSYYRILLHKLCDRFLLKSGSDGLWEERAIRVEYTEQAQIPLLSLCDWIVKPKQVLCEQSLDHVTRGGLRCPTDKFDSMHHEDFLPVSKGVACRYKWRQILPNENLARSQDIQLSSVGLEHIAEFVFENAPTSMVETQALVDEICSSAIDKACEMIIVDENTCLVLVPSQSLLPQLISYERPGISIRDLANATDYTKRRAGFPTFKRKKTDLSIFNRVVNRSLGIRKQQQQQNRKEECKLG